MKVEPDEHLLKMFSSLKSGLSRDSIKWTSSDNIHITIAFLGDTGEEVIQVIREMLRSKCGNTGTFEIVLKGAGVFKSLTDPRIIWTGIEPSAKLAELNRIIVSGLKNAGVILEERPFRPHLTLGRIKILKDNNSLSALLDKYKDVVLQSVFVDEIILYESILLQTGPVYKAIEKFKIKQ